VAASPPWYRVVSDPGVLRRAVITGVGVGTILTIANNTDVIQAGTMPESRLLPIAVTYAVPFLVSLASSVLALRVERRDQGQTTRLLEREIEAIVRFPGQNPNPVMRLNRDGQVIYANDSSRPVRGALGVEVGDTLPTPWFERVRTAQSTTDPVRFEVEHGRQTFAVLAVWVQDLGVYNLYGTDITGAKVVERFPDDNPNPVLRMSPEGQLLYANAASRPIIRALAIEPGDPLPGDLLTAIQRAIDDDAAPTPEIAGDGRIFHLRPVVIPEFEFVNLYGIDVTALKAVDKFPNENPNPVVRLDRDGRVSYANPASELLRRALGADVGDQLDPLTFQRVLDALDGDATGALELTAEGRVYEVRVVRVYEFESINLYGTDITAARQVEELSAANEKLLLSILPPSIAERLRGGETVIADRFDDMAVLFADIVDFTALSSRLAPIEVIELLNEVFRMCDELAERYGLEKIKTVGDAYMVVGGPGLGDDRSNGRRPGSDGFGSHAADVASMALAMLTELARFREASGHSIEVRIGMNVGPAVAGVIGLKKFIYDVWGDTVNTASRMESTGVPGRIQVTRETYERLCDDFEFERRGPIEVKGKGTIETWFLVGRRSNDIEEMAVPAAEATA